MAHMVGGGAFLDGLLVMLMILALMLRLMTARTGSSRTLYQGSVGGWLPKSLSHVDAHGAPTRAMWTDLVLLAIACAAATSLVFILAVSNCGHIIFNFLNLDAGWLHRIASAHSARPYKAPTILIALGTVYAFINAAFMGAGAKVWNPMALRAGLIATTLTSLEPDTGHDVLDGGRFRPQILADLQVAPGARMERRAGLLPYLTLAGGVAVVLIANWVFQT